MGAQEDRSRKLLEARKPADSKALRSRSIEVLRRMQREEESVRSRRQAPPAGQVGALP
jgi:hypothetical protein